MRLWERLYAHSRDFGQKGTYIEAMSALDIAHWDIWGKALGQPVHALLGGAFRDRVHAYATGCYYPEDIGTGAAMLDALAAEAEEHIRSGFSTLKMKIGLLSIAQDGKRVAAVREAIGPDVALLVDANHAYNAAGAIRMGRELERWQVGWFEEPVVPEDRAGYRRVRDALSIPVAGGECEFTRYGFRDLFQGECIDIAQPDLCVCGGYSEWLKIQALALAHSVLTIPHVWGSGVALATRAACARCGAADAAHRQPGADPERAGGRVRPAAQLPARRATCGDHRARGRLPRRAQWPWPRYHGKRRGSQQVSNRGLMEH